MATKIYIDQGHNPVNPNAGAEGFGYREQDIVYRVGVMLSEILSESGFETRLSRASPTQQLGTSNLTSLQTRVNEANSWGADYFISLHTNASSNPSAGGSEALVYREGSTAARLARSILEQLSRATGLRNRGVVIRSGLYVLRKTRMPAVLVELGFITNPSEAELMASSPRLFAGGIANGIIEFVSEEDGAVFSELESEYVAANARDEADFEFEKELEEEEEDEGGDEGETVPETDELIGDYESFIREHPERGLLRIQASIANGAYPVSGLRTVITKKFTDGERIFFSGFTDENGIIDGIELPAPPVRNSLDFSLPNKASSYVLRTDSQSYEDTERLVEIYRGVKTIQPLHMYPKWLKP